MSLSLKTTSYASPSLNSKLEVKPTLEDILLLAEKINSEDKSTQSEGLIGIRKLLSLKYNPPIQEIINTGIVPKILDFLTWSSEPQFQFESSWVVTNICSGTSQHVDYIVELGGLDTIFPLLESTSNEILEQAVWALGNVAGDKMEYRDLCANKGLMVKLVQILEKSTFHSDLQKNTIWAMSNLVRGKPIAEWQKIKIGIEAFAKIIKSLEFDEAIVDALWGISWASEKYIQEVIDLGCVASLVHYLGNPLASVIVPALRALGNIVTGNDLQTNVCLSHPNFLPLVFGLTTHQKKNIRKEAFWLLSNIAAGNQYQIAMIVQNKLYMERLKLGVLSENPEVQIEASWAVGNLVSGASPTQVAAMINEHHCIDSLKAMIKDPNKKMKLIGLEATLNVLVSGDKLGGDNPYVPQFIEKGLIQLITKQGGNTVDEQDKIVEIMEFFSSQDLNSYEVEENGSPTIKEAHNSPKNLKVKKEEEDSDEGSEDEESDEDSELSSDESGSDDVKNKKMTTAETKESEFQHFERED